MGTACFTCELVLRVAAGRLGASLFAGADLALPAAPRAAAGNRVHAPSSKSVGGDTLLVTIPFLKNRQKRKVSILLSAD